MARMDRTERAQAEIDLLRVTVLENEFVPEEHRTPHEKQARFLLDPRREVLFGGSAGSGKTEGLILSALQFVGVPGYAALILRRSYPDLALPGAIMDRAMEWLRPRADVRWIADTKTFLFPSGASLTFGYLQGPQDHLRYQGAEFQTCIWDELTQFADERQYLYLFSRLRRLEGRSVPLRMRAGTNPGGPGHEWVRRRFLDSREPDRGFIPAWLADNPSLDQADYVESLMHLDPLTRRRLLEGDWSARAEGSLFRREWFAIEDRAPENLARVRWWDLSAGGDFSAGLLLGRDATDRYHVIDVVRAKLPPADVEALVKRTAEADGPGVVVLFGEEPGSAGKSLVDHYRRHVLPLVRVEGVRETGAKYTRAQPVAGQAANGNVLLVRGAWVEAFLDELEAFTDDERSYAHDDQVDALSGAYGVLAARAGRQVNPNQIERLFGFEGPRARSGGVV